MNPCMDAQKKYSREAVFVGLSILFHFFLFLILYFTPAQITPAPENTVFIDLSALPPPPDLAKEQEAAKKMQIVQSERAENDVAPKDAKFLGERSQTVQEETRAKNVDLFQKGSAAQKMGGKGQALSLKDLAPAKTIAPPTQREIDGFKKEQEKMAKAETGDGRPVGEETPGAATNDYLKDTKDSNRTMLNTKEFVYYSYYHRIRQKLEVAWNSKLRATLGSYSNGMNGGRQLASEKNYVTGVIVVLDRNGKVTGVQMLERSGAHDLDQAAVDAFNEAGPFPDPPTGLVDEKGEIKIRWDFILQS